MALAFKKGDRVRHLPAVPFEGIVAEARIVDDDIQYLVTEGDQSRWFTADQIEAVTS